MNVLIACEESQRVCTEFRKLGHNAYSCDIQKCGGEHPEWHIRGDVIPFINGNCAFITQGGTEEHITGRWDLLIAHPPCTFISNAGARHLYPHGILNEERYLKGLQAVDFFMRFYKADCEHIAIENPRPSKCFNLPAPTQITSPHYFGSNIKKTTLLWLKNLPPLMPTIINSNAISCNNSMWFNGRAEGGASRQVRRSRTDPLFAQAIAQQWSEYIGRNKSCRQV